MLLSLRAAIWKENKTEENTTPFDVNLMRSQVLYRAAQAPSGLGVPSQHDSGYSHMQMLVTHSLLGSDSLLLYLGVPSAEPANPALCKARMGALLDIHRAPVQTAGAHTSTDAVRFPFWLS